MATRVSSSKQELTADSAYDQSQRAEAYNNETQVEANTSKESHDWRFWLVFLSLCLLSCTSALDGSIITTALPTITSRIGGADQYVWIANSFTLAQTAIQPLTAQLCDIFGRRFPTLIAVALFVLGSGIAGGASNVSMLIAGRAMQGLGSGAIYLLVDLIVCDLVALRERGKYLGIVLSTAALGAILGPVVGGALAEDDWRWVFYINLPIAGVVLVVMGLLLRLKNKSPAWSEVVRQVDWVGNGLFIASMTAILLGLIFGGVVFPWSSWRVILPLVLGGGGWVTYHFYEASSFCKSPSIPPQLFTNRTSFISFVLSFLAALLLQWTIYFLPIYFQGVRGTSPLTSGVDILPYNAFLIPFAMLAGGIMSKTGSYRPLHALGFAFVSLGIGLFAILNRTSNKAIWVILQLFTAIGQGFLATTILPAIQAALPVGETAAATGTYAFLRSFGFVWGVTIPSIVFNAQIDANLGIVSDASLAGDLAGGHAYGQAASGIVRDASNQAHNEVAEVYRRALEVVWEVAVALGLLGFLLSFMTKHVELRKEIDSDFGLESGRRQSDSEQ